MASVPPVSALPFAAPSWLLVGGSFDPPHVGHIVLPARTRDRICPDAALLFVPAARSPHKSVGPAASNRDRLDMLRAALEGVPNAAVWTDELDRADSGSPSYWVETLRRLRSVAPDTELRFVIGADQAVVLHRWREAPAILELAEPVVLLREPIASAGQLRHALDDLGVWSEAHAASLAASAVDVGTINASSTEARRLLAEDRENARLESLLAPGVLEIIRERGIYRGGAASAHD